jgi:Na+-driven multidrug efflux pump
VLIAYLRSSRSLITLAFRGVPLEWSLFAEILKVGVPGLGNVAITNMSVVLLTGIAGRLGTQAAIGYAMGARLEYILIPLGVGTLYLQIVGPIYGFYGLGIALHFAMQGFGSVVLIVVANGVRLLASAGRALIAIYWFDLGAIGFFLAVAIGFCAFAAMAVSIMLRVTEPANTPDRDCVN